jgi:hypothetical protein
MDVHAEGLKKTVAAVGECADTITKVGQRVDIMVARMDKTDERWNQLIDQAGRSGSCFRLAGRLVLD